MKKVITLPDVLVSKIAAGEIVERPASVVKELIENSIDAEATRISIHLEAGGKNLIRVVDNGHGMSRDDALMSIERHATSKIRDIDDLFSVKTLGFRGEALPSIASVSQFRMITCAEGSQTGTEIHVEGGVVRKVEDAASPVGSSIEVKNLFFNTPARFKFLKKPETEMNRVLEVIQREAMSRPGVSFEIFSGDKSIYRYSLAESLGRRVEQILPGVSFYEISFEDEMLIVNGFLGSPLDPRSSMRKLFTYVNGRPVKDRFINRIIMDSYGKMVEKGKYPQGALFIERDPALVDVNVHPTKSEVLFENQYAVGRSIAAAIKNMLLEAPWMTSHRERAHKALEDFYEKQKHSQSDEKGGYAGEGIPTRNPRETTEPRPEIAALRTQVESLMASEEPEKESKEDMFSRGFYSDLKFIGQIGKLYLVCENSDGMIIVDQHAAHEKINFEKIKKNYLEEAFSCSQELLLPEVIELSAQEIGIVRQFTDEISRLGFGFEIFGENAVRVKAVPGFLKDSNYAKVFKDLLDEIDDLGGAKSLEESLDALCATVACHSSITASHALSEIEVRTLFENMDVIENPHFCPHGRPVSTRVSYNMLEKMFKRT